MNETNPKTYWYLLKKDGMPSGASPSLDAWVSLNISWGSLGIPKLELLPLLLLLIPRPPRSSNTSSTQNFNQTFSGGVSEYGNEIPSCTVVTLLYNYKQTLPTVCYHNSKAPSQGGFNKNQTYANNEAITAICENRTVCKDLNIHHTSITQKFYEN